MTQLHRRIGRWGLGLAFFLSLSTLLAAGPAWGAAHRKKGKGETKGGAKKEKPKPKKWKGELEWKESVGSAFISAAPIEHAVVVVAKKDARTGLLHKMSRSARPKGKARIKPSLSRFMACVDFYLVDPDAVTGITRVFGLKETPATLVLSRGGALINQMPGIPTEDNVGEFLDALAAIKANTEERAESLKTELDELEKSLRRMKMKEAAKTVGDLAKAIKKADFDTLMGIRGAAHRIALNRMAEALSSVQLVALGGDKEKALKGIAFLENAFKDIGPALERVKKARAEIEAGKVGLILGEWWRGGALGVVFYTGVGAQKHKTFSTVGQEVAKELGLPYQEIHAADCKGSPEDKNGILLYPDGTTRVRLMLMPGGSGYKTWLELGGVNGNPKCQVREWFQQAFHTGMNYVGCCGGAFFATSGHNHPRAFVTQFCFWPGKTSMEGTGRGNPHPDIILDPRHPLAKNKAVQDGVLKTVFFNGGPTWMQPDVPGTEYIGMFRGGSVKALPGQVALLAYVDTEYRGGRLVICGAHPEVKYPGFVKAMADYTFDRLYALPQNPILSGKAVKNISGDNQYQYYYIRVSEGAAKLEVTLTGMDGNCDLYVRRGNLARPKKASHKSTKGGDADESIAISTPRPGIYFVGVHGKHEKLNGVNYTLTATVGN